MNNNELLNTLMGALQNPDYKDKISYAVPKKIKWN